MHRTSDRRATAGVAWLTGWRWAQKQGLSALSRLGLGRAERGICRDRRCRFVLGAGRVILGVRVGGGSACVICRGREHIVLELWFEVGRDMHEDCIEKAAALRKYYLWC